MLSELVLGWFAIWLMEHSVKTLYRELYGRPFECLPCVTGKPDKFVSASTCRFYREGRPVDVTCGHRGSDYATIVIDIVGMKRIIVFVPQSTTAGP